MRFVGIDPSTKTGFVALDKNGEILRAKELTGVSNEDPRRMVTLIDEVVTHLQPGDFICIEGFPFDTQRAMFAGGLHHGIRNELFKRKLPYYEIAPNAVKKYVNVTGWVGEKGNKKRLTGPQKKKAVMDAVVREFGFYNNSDNVVDAFILAKIAKDLWTINSRNQCSINEGFLPNYQAEVLQNILYPQKKKAK